MRESWKVYVVAAIVLVVSFVAAWNLPTTEALRGIIGLPGVGALFAVLYQIVRDRAAHERALELQQRGTVLQSRRGFPYGKCGV